MDRDSLRAALERWTDAGVIDEETAARIREFERADDGAETGDATVEPTDGDGDGGLLEENRVVVALALMGGVLVAVGVGVFLYERWESIPVVVRVAILVGIPVAAGGSGARLREGSPRTAHGLWLLAALFTGVTLFRLAELAAVVDVDAAEPWLLAAWTGVAIAIAAGLDSRPIGGAGAVLGAATLVSATDPSEFVLLFGAYGGLVYAAGLTAAGDPPLAADADHDIPRFTATLRWVGGGFAVAALVPIVAVGSPPQGTSAGTVLLVAASAVAAAVAVGRAGGDRLARYAAAPAVAAPAAAVLVWTLTGRVGDFAGSLVALACLLALVLALVVGAVGLREAAPANVAALGFVLGVLAFLVGPIGDAISGSLALVAAGTVLLAAGLGAERGRRAVLARIG
ncbi:Uncharacterized membrane protein [Halorubrum aquaticum]|uniref:Uncharacterized membrane protein n=1 Tax=Halorubrum aquaticum TaxID=387340 RepID=A0A1I3AU93_9EURY|nr:DUF2157 domain-containing protein [Halorubrum aquaticum]SFH53574.1 Uncharacterized membrane protein [Halorubrum aquaticum]